MKSVSSIGLPEAARISRKSTRQLMRDIKVGKLATLGGGRGIPYVLKRADVVAYATPSAGVVCADLLARIAHALHLKQKSQDTKWLPWFESTMLWKWHSQGEALLLDLARRSSFPPLEEVPTKTTTWARRLASSLAPDELDYVGAMFVVTAWPWRKYDKAERWALSRAIKTMGRHQRKDELDFISAFESGDVTAIRNLTEDFENSTGQFSRAKLPGIRNADETDAPWSLLSASRKVAQDRKDRGSGKPTGGKVAILLGIHRFQGSRLTRRIMAKLGPQGVVGLFRLLGCEVPRAWKDKMKRPASIDNSPRASTVAGDKSEAWDIASYLAEEAAPKYGRGAEYQQDD